MGGSAKTKQNQTSTYTPTPEASQFYTGVLDKAQNAVTPYDPATAKTVAGFTDPQTQAFQNIGANQGNWAPNVNAGGQMIAGAGQGIAAGDISKFFNPFQQDVVNTTMQTVNDQDAMARRGYTANQTAQGALGGNGFGLGLGQLTGQQSQARNATVANLNSAGWDKALAAAQTDKTRGLQAGQAQAGIGQLIAQLSGQDASQLLTAGNQQQAQQQNVNDTASTNALNKQLWEPQMAQWLAGIGSGIGPLTGGTTTGSGTSTQSQGKGAGSILGSGLSLAAMMSDERTKENPVPIGKTFDGQPIYEFNYIGDPRRQIGLMAQDVEQSHPEAVSEIGGIKHVNYDTALEGSQGAGFADGGLALPQGLMGWSDIRPAQVRPPELARMDAPSGGGEGDGGTDLQAMWDMGKKAGTGLSSLFGGGAKMPMASSPAGGAMAASGLQGLGGAGGIAGLFGFADGGMVPTPEEMYALEMQESGGRDIINPKSGAFGPRQIMPATARDPGFGVAPLPDGAGVDEQRRFSDDYYGAMLRRYGGDRDAARIAYNGGPRRADQWLKAGRDDSVIPAESANYYKQIAGRLGPQAASLVAKGQGASSEAGEGYQGKADRATGGMLKRTFGIDFNPLGLTEPERKALLVAGLSMMATGNIGKGGVAGMQYLAGTEAGEREYGIKAAELKRSLDKDAADLALRTRAEDRMGTKDATDQEWRKGEVDRKNTELTTDQKEYKAAQAEGYTGTFTEFQLAQKRAGSAAGVGLPAEVGARIGLGRVFTGMLPDIEKRIGELGTMDMADLALGRGKAGALWRDIETGREALVRGLTGAGMAATEAENAAARYQISSTDTTETMLSKVRNLKRDLEAVEGGAIEGKGGSMAKTYEKPVPVAPSAADVVPAPARPRAKNAVGAIIEYDGSAWVPVQ